MYSAYILFHLNLAFSSIEACQRPTVIEKCYWPMLKLIKTLGLPVGVELTGWTLKELRTLDPLWVRSFADLLDTGNCELIGSGWSQLIGPLVPAKVNYWNQKLGIEAYEEILQRRPRIALINEMAFSTSMVNHYLDAGYKGIVMDRDNVRYALGLEGEPLDATPNKAQGLGNKAINILWSDSVLFQKLQKAVHGDIPLEEYYAYVEKRIHSDSLPLPIYCNDAEVFDFRPGRFNTENALHPEGEWARLERLLNRLKEYYGLHFCSPSAALEQQKLSLRKQLFLSTAANPIPVKKQRKYNVHRWATSGRNTTWLNTKCFEMFETIKNTDDPREWATLCEFWASDYRTHITEKRWASLLSAINNFEKRKCSKPLNDHQSLSRTKLSGQKLKEVRSKGVEVKREKEGMSWLILTPSLEAEVSTRRGLSLKSLTFRGDTPHRSIGELAQGYFNTLPLAADFYSGNCVLEFPELRKRITDLEWVEPLITENPDDFTVSASINCDTFTIEKSLTFSKVSPKVCFQFEFHGLERRFGTIRAPIFSLLPEAFPDTVYVQCANGGYDLETFRLTETFDHSQAVSSLVSATAAFGATTGLIKFINGSGQGVQFSWKPSSCAMIPMLQHVKLETTHFTRIIFTLQEFDETFKAGDNVPAVFIEVSRVNEATFSTLC
jgi:hypothetical protein